MEDERNKQKGKDKNIVDVHVCTTVAIIHLLSAIPKLLLNCNRLYFKISIHELQLSAYEEIPNYRA